MIAQGIPNPKNNNGRNVKVLFPQQWGYIPWINSPGYGFGT